jgi:hypothetical protein
VAAIKRAAEITLKQSDIGGYQRGRILGLRLLGIGTRLAGDAMGARDYIADALAGCRATRFVEVEPDLLIQLASCRLDLGDVTGASAIAAESLELARMLRYRPNVAEACLFSARILADSSKEAAKEWCEEALAASFGPNWRAFIIADHWKETWWEACLSDRARLTVGIVNEDWWWKSGYKPVMDDALKLWTYLGPPA